MDKSDERTMSSFKEFLLTFFMPEKCYEQIFLYFNFMHVPCLKIILSKTMGIYILMGTVFAPLLQIWKVLWSGSSVGLCLISVVLELLAISAYTAFCYKQHFPIGAWGEALFTLIQIAVLAFLIQHYRGKTIKGLYFLALYCGFMFLLASPLTPVSVVWTMHEWNVLLVIAGRFVFIGRRKKTHFWDGLRLIQACSNYRCGHTGQISALAVVLVFLGSLGRIFSLLQETGLSFSTQMHALASCYSGMILAQVLLYWNKCMTSKEQEVQVEKEKAE